MSSSVDIADWVHRKNGHHCAQMGWCIANDAGVPLKYSDLVNVVTACSLCSKQYPRQLPKESGAIHYSFQLVRDWQVDYMAPSVGVSVLNMFCFV